MEDSNKQRLIVFSNDRAMNETVYNFLLDVFLSLDSKDVNVLASAYLAQSLLKKGFQKMDNLVSNNSDNLSKIGPVGL